MLKFRWTAAALFIWVLTAGPALAADLGDPAPPLKIKDWVKGKPVDLKAGKGKTVYVVEFWATWCPPCRDSIPHLTEMQKKFKDKGVVFVGISDEPTGKVKPFVTKMGKKMNYVVAVDDGTATNKAYMKAFGIGGIPHAFIVDQSGAIAWHGHPMAEMDKVIERILAGTYDLAAAKQAEKASKLMHEYFEMVTEGGESKDAAKLGKKIVNFGGSDPQLMNQFAWILLTTPGIRNRDLGLAVKAAKAAYHASDGKDASVLDTYARALWDSGKKAEAVKLQKKAVKLCKDARMRKELKKSLAKYEKEAAETEG